jgi:hypothetical protein
LTHPPYVGGVVHHVGVFAGQAHALRVQVWWNGHAFPHAPQLLESWLVSTHAPPHGVVAGGHTQAPFEQDPPFGHPLPQLPQLPESWLVSTHVLPHCVVAGGHGQAPFEQDTPFGHRWPQLPQLSGSLCRLASQPSPRDPLQSPNPGLHVWPHEPMAQTADAFGGAVQAMPQ